MESIRPQTGVALLLILQRSRHLLHFNWKFVGFECGWGKGARELGYRHTYTPLQAYSRGCFYFINTLRAHLCLCVCVCGLPCLHVTFVDFVSPLLWRTLPLMMHISCLQSVPNPGSTGSGADYCFQTPEVSSIGG